MYSIKNLSGDDLMESLFISQLFGVVSKDVAPVVILFLIIYHLFSNNKTIERIEKTIEKSSQDTKDSFLKLSQRIDVIEKEFVTKEQHYQDVDGWRGEIHRLEDKMERFFDRLTKLIEYLEERRK